MSSALVVGSPNSGKSLLFNRLTGLNQKVANFPGITVDTHSGRSRRHRELQLVDLPGVYSLQALSGEEEVAIAAFQRALLQGDTSSVLVVVDATRLEKGLIFALQVLDAARQNGKRVVVAANMMDTLERHGLALDVEGLSAALGVPVIPVSARASTGLAELEQALVGGEGTPAPTDIIAADEAALRHRAEEMAAQYGPKGDLLIASANRADGFFLHSMTGGVSFLLIMYLLFQSIFTWSAPAMDAVENSLAWLAGQIVPMVDNQLLKDFLTDALFGGFGAFLVFVPQIFVLTFVVGLLEDSGYLARAAVICHRPLRLFGLNGRSFVPMLSGVACAIPGIYAARTVESPRRRWLTYLAIPLMPCSARLPVYALLITAFIPAETVLGGWVGLQGLAMFGIYLFGIVTGLLVTALVSKTGAGGDHDDAPFVLEMPPYRVPSWLPLVRGAWDRSKQFVYRAGPVIFWVTMVVWVLGYFPNHGEDLGTSWLGYLGRLIEPVFAPLGLDWKYGVAILASFLAREVFVGTLGTLFGIEGADEDVISLAQRVQDSGLALGSGFALLVFFAIAAQCVSTLAVLRRESGSWRLPAQMFVGYGLLAYTSAFVVYHLVELFAG